MASITQLQKDFGRFKEDFDLVGTHLGRAQSKFGEAEKRLDRFEGRLEQSTEHEEIEAPADAGAIEEQALPLELDSIPTS
jgi:DNA recombination protein RmuC